MTRNQKREQRKAAICFHPGEMLKDELDDRKLSISDFANIVGWPVGVTRKFVNGKTRLTLEMCMDLSDALGTSREFWANLWWLYLDWKAEQE